MIELIDNYDPLKYHLHPFLTYVEQKVPNLTVEVEQKQKQFNNMERLAKILAMERILDNDGDITIEVERVFFLRSRLWLQYKSFFTTDNAEEAFTFFINAFQKSGKRITFDIEQFVISLQEKTKLIFPDLNLEYTEKSKRNNNQNATESTALLSRFSVFSINGSNNSELDSANNKRCCIS